MHFLEFLKNTFLKQRPKSADDLSEEEALQISFRITVVEFSDNVESKCGEIITSFLRRCSGLNVSYFDEPFDKSFLSLDNRSFFDFVDKGQNILEKTNSDVLIWGHREGNKLRLNFQTAHQFDTEGDSLISLLDCLYFPTSLFTDGGANFPSSLLTLLYGAVICSLNLTDKVKRIQKNYLLKKIIYQLSQDNSAKNLSIDFLPYVMNFLGTIYLSSCLHNASSKDFKIVKNLLDTAIKHQDLIKNSLHLGCIYNHLGQLYDIFSEKAPQNHGSFYGYAISNYRFAQKYLGKYNYPYNYGIISYRLSELFYKYWCQKEDLQALRDAVFNLREAEKIFTYALFPRFWAHIQGKLGYIMSLLSSATANNEIAELAVNAYKNQQKIITEKRDPLQWANIQEKIGEIYYRIGKKDTDYEILEESLEYFHDSLYIFENMNLTDNAKRITSAIARTNRILNYH